MKPVFPAKFSRDLIAASRSGLGGFLGMSTNQEFNARMAPAVIAGAIRLDT
jgi:hypothetical protein